MAKGNTPTPHIGAKFGEIAETVIMSGDPWRARFIAESGLQERVMYSHIRGMDIQACIKANVSLYKVMAWVFLQ